MEDYFALMATRFDEFSEAAREAVEVIEDMHEQSDAEADKWFRKWMDECSTLNRTQGALRDAEARVAELHKELEIASRMNRNQFRLLSRIRDAVDDSSDYEAAIATY